MNSIDRSFVLENLRLMQTAQVNQAQSNLMQAAASIGFFQAILSIIVSHQQEWIKTIACTFLNRVMCQLTTIYKSEQLCEGLLHILMNPSIKNMDKRCFERAIIRMFEEVDEKMVQEWSTVAIKMLAGRDTMDSGLLLIACFAVSQTKQCYLYELISATFQTSITSIQIHVSNAALLNQILKTWIVVIDKLYQLPSSFATLQVIINKHALFDFLDLVYEMNANENIIICLQQQLYELNLLKYEAAQLQKRVLRFAQENQIVGQYAFNHLKRKINLITQTLFYIAQNKQKMQTYSCEDLICTLMTLQNIYVINFPSALKGAWQGLVDQVLFKFIEVGPEELLSFEDNAEQFNGLAQDCCDKQTFGILKTETAKCLELLGEKIEECCSYIIKKCIYSLKSKLGFINILQQNLLSVETSFMILSIFSFSLQKFKHQMSQLKVMLCDQRLQKLPPFEISRLFLFLGYNYGEVFAKPADGQHWIAVAINYNLHKTAEYFALDFISNVADEYYNEKFLIAFADKIVTQESNIGLIFDIADKMISWNYALISKEGLQYLTAKIFGRIQLELHKLANKTQESSLTLVNCLHLFRIILKTQNDTVLKQGVAREAINKRVKELIWPVTQLYHPLFQFDVEDQIANIVLEYCSSHFSEILPQVWVILPSFLQTFKKNDYCQKVYIKLINQIIMKGNIQNLGDIILTLKSAFLFHIMQLSQKKKSVQLVALGNIMILIQNLLAVHGSDLLAFKKEDLFIQFSSLAVRLVPSPKDPKKKEDKTIIARALNILLLCHVYIKTDNTLDYLIQYSNESVFRGYDTKVLIMCLGKQLFKQTDIAVVTALINLMVTIVIKSDEKDDTIEKRKASKKINTKDKLLIKKLESYEKILNGIDTPFKCKSAKNEIKQLINIMKQNNSEVYMIILKNIDQKVRIYLTDLLATEYSGNKKPRIIRKVIGVKEPIEKQQKMQERQDEDDDEQEQEDLSKYKRKRMNKTKITKPHPKRKTEDHSE